MSERWRNEPLYRPLFRMPRNGFSREEYVQAVLGSNNNYTEEYADKFIRSLVAGRILHVHDGLYYFAWREDSPHRRT